MQYLKYFIDTEFIERPGLLVPISIGIVCEDGRELYLVSNEFDANLADNWVKKNVLLKLPPKHVWKSLHQCAKQITEFVNSPNGNQPLVFPEFWAYYASHDWVCFCWFMQSRMIDMPYGWPSLCMDLKQSMLERRMPSTFLPKPDEAKEHDALEDARWLKTAHEAVFGR